MFQVELDAQLINGFLTQVPGQRIDYRQGCFIGKFKLPLGALTAVIIPSCNGSQLLFAIPFSAIKGDITGKFLLSKLVKAFWGMISKKVEAAVAPQLRKVGLPPHTVKVEKAREKGGDVGRIVISLLAVNKWLGQKHPSLKVSLSDFNFTPEGVAVSGELASKGAPAKV